MSNRVRLTARMAADGSIPYPGNVNQPDRTDPSWEQYHTFEQQVNHELPDMRHEWKDDSRDDIGFGVPESNPPTVASVRIAANKAVRIAVLLLGEKVSDSVIEAQARDLMAMNGEAMDRTLDRFAQTQELYAKDEEVKEEVKEEEKKASAELADKGKEVPEAIKSEDKTEEKKEEKVEEKPAEVKAEEKKMPDFIQEKIDEKKEKDEKKAADEVKEEVKEEEKKASDDEDEDDKQEVCASQNEMDIEMTGAMDDDMKDDPEADAQLASLFDGGLTATDDEDKDDAEKTAKSKKAGIKKLGGQPKVAAQGAAQADISSIWQTAPDVSEVFR